jgi:hypothetical protein
MPSLSEFSKNFVPKQKPQQNEQINVSELDQQKIAQEFQKLSGQSQDELMQQLFEQSARLKAQGKFDANALIKAVESMGNMLDANQKQKMLDLINKIK